MIIVISHGDSIVDQVSRWTRVYQSSIACCNDFGFMLCTHFLEEVCATSGCRQSRPLSKLHNVLGDVSCKIVNICLPFANTGMNSTNLVSYARWRELHGLTLRLLHLL
jgi:hypothetical protein